MNVSSNASDLISYQGLIEPVAGSSTYTTGWVYCGGSDAWSALVTAGAVTGTVDAKLEQYDGSTTKDVTGSDITQLAAPGTVIIQCKPGDLDTANDFDRIRLSITTSNAADVAAGALIGACVRNAPLASGSKVDETVTV